MKGCVQCGKQLDGISLVLCNECRKKLDINLRRGREKVQRLRKELKDANP